MDQWWQVDGLKYKYNRAHLLSNIDTMNDHIDSVVMETRGGEFPVYSSYKNTIIPKELIVARYNQIIWRE